MVLFICEIPGFQFPFDEQTDLYCPLSVRLKKLAYSDHAVRVFYFWNCTWDAA